MVKSSLLFCAVAAGLNSASGTEGVIIKPTTAQTRVTKIPITFHDGFWFGSFSVGSSSDLSLLIDTGSDDVVVNPGIYQPSARSHDLNETLSMSFSTTESDGCGAGSMTNHIYTDTVRVSGMRSLNQTVGSVVKITPPNNWTITQFPQQGLVGFNGLTADDSSLGGVPFFQNLCNQGEVAECRFGIAPGTSGTGNMVLGGIDKSLIQHDLVTVPLNQSQWIIKGGVPKDMVQTSDVQYMLLDSGTSNIIGNNTLVRALFDKLGIQSVEQSTADCANHVFGYYPCDSPPRVGFQIGNSSKTFFIEPEAFKLRDNGNNNCTATITGGHIGPGAWIVGQSWFQGKYVDFNVEKAEIGVAILRY